MMIRLLLLLLLSAAPLSASLAVTTIGVTNTSAAVRISGATGGSCTLELSESSTFLPLHADVDNSKYPGSNSCAGRPDTMTNDSDLIVWLGHRVSDRALYTDHNYYLRVTSDSDTATLAFKTDTIGVGQSYPWPVPVDRRKWANRGFGIAPSDLATKSPQVDPITGVQMWPIGGMNDITVREGPFSFVHWSDGTGWTNPSRIIDAASSGAQTSNTNPITLYIGPESDPNNWLYSATGWNDLGILVYACGDDRYPANRSFTISFSNNFSAAVESTPITVSSVGHCASPPAPLPQVRSTSTDTDKPWPSNFPCAPFCGWGPKAFIGWDDRPMQVSGTVASNVFTASGLDLRHHFSPRLEVGNKVVLPGCTQGSGMCDIDSLGGSAKVTLSGSVTNGTATATVLRAGIQIQKATATGNLWVSVRYKIGEAYLLNTTGGSLQTICNNNSGPITTYDGHAGYLCVSTGYTTGMAFMYFLSSDGTSRLVWHGGRPPDSYFTGLGWDAADIPRANASLFTVAQILPDPVDPRGWYLYLSNAAPYELYHLHYGGDVHVIDTGYNFNQNGGSTFTPIKYPNDFIDWTTLTPSKHTLGSQLSNFPYYPGSVFGVNGFVFYGASGHSLYFENILGGQDHAGWVAVGDISTGALILKNVFSSYDGQGIKGRTHHGSIHNIGSRPFPPDTVIVSLNSLPYQGGDPGNHPYEGEWQMPIVAVDRGSVGHPVWSSDTSLPWPIDNTYLNTCPSNTWGITGNKCVHLKVAKGGFCNVQPHATIEASSPCPTTPVIADWNASGYRQSLTTRQGDMFVDRAPSGQACYVSDCENFLIITDLMSESDGYTSFWVSRDAAYDYCTITGLNPANSPAQHRHNSGWRARSSPMGLRGCSGAALVVQGQTESSLSVFEIPRTLLGHTDLVKGSCSGCIGFVAATSGNEAMNLDDLFDLTKVKSFATPTWHGSPTALGSGVQAYAISPGGTSWFTDANAINGNGGGPPEVIGASMGPPSTITDTSCPDVYLITVTGTTDYKNLPLRGVAGSYPLQELSSPTVDLCSGSVPGFTLAYAYRNGEAMSGTISGAGTSQAGQTFIKVPNAQAKNFGLGSCNVTQHWANTPCVLGGNWIGGGFYRQRDYLQNDSGGIRSRWLTGGLEVPLAQYPYSVMMPLDDSMAWLSWSMVAGWGMTPWIVKLPRFIDDSATSMRTDYINKLVTVSAVAGSTKARVRFGRNKDFYCMGSEAIAADGSLDWSGRKEACVTDAGAEPFRFVGETQTLKDCASGCLISVPLVAQTINYAQVEHLDSDGAIIQTDSVQVLVAGNVTEP